MPGDGSSDPEPTAPKGKGPVTLNRGRTRSCRRQQTTAKHRGMHATGAENAEWSSGAGPEDKDTQTSMPSDGPEALHVRCVEMLDERHEEKEAYRGGPIGTRHP